jgi:hypothetical protein
LPVPSFFDDPTVHEVRIFQVILSRIPTEAEHVSPDAPGAALLAHKMLNRKLRYGKHNNYKHTPGTTATFQHSVSGQVKTLNAVAGFWWALLFGPFYLIACGAPGVGVAWLFVSVAISVSTGGLGMIAVVPAWWIYCFHAQDAIRKKLLEQGYVRIDAQSTVGATPVAADASHIIPKFKRFDIPKTNRPGRVILLVLGSLFLLALLFNGHKSESAPVQSTTTTQASVTPDSTPEPSSTPVSSAAVAATPKITPIQEFAWPTPTPAAKHTLLIHHHHHGDQ